MFVKVGLPKLLSPRNALLCLCHIEPSLLEEFVCEPVWGFFAHRSDHKLRLKLATVPYELLVHVVECGYVLLVAGLHAGIIYFELFTKTFVEAH